MEKLHSSKTCLKMAGEGDASPPESAPAYGLYDESKQA